MQVPVLPTKVGQQVRATGYGGQVRQYMVGHEGVVVRITRKGNPVVRFKDAQPTSAGYYIGGNFRFSDFVTDHFGCFKVLTDEGKLAWREVEV